MQQAAKAEREKEERRQERERLAELDRLARKALGQIKVGDKVKVCTALQAQDGFVELARRWEADVDAKKERAAAEAARLAAEEAERAAAAAEIAAAEAAAQAEAEERGEGGDEALAELEALLGEKPVSMASAGPQLEPEPEPEPEPEIQALQRDDDKSWGGKKMFHCAQEATVLLVAEEDISVLLRFEDGWVRFSIAFSHRFPIGFLLDCPLDFPLETEEMCVCRSCGFPWSASKI